MAESIPSAAAGTSTVTETVVVDTTDGQPATETVQLTLRKPRTDRKVQWSNETVDNEHMNKKKSKCCCVYKKPREFDESSSEDSDDECDHCSKHVEKKKTLKLKQVEATTAAAEALNEVLEDIPPLDPDDPDIPTPREA